MFFVREKSKYSWRKCLYKMAIVIDRKHPVLFWASNRRTQSQYKCVYTLHTHIQSWHRKTNINSHHCSITASYVNQDRGTQDGWHWQWSLTRALSLQSLDLILERFIHSENTYFYDIAGYYLYLLTNSKPYDL